MLRICKYLFAIILISLLIKPVFCLAQEENTATKTQDAVAAEDTTDNQNQLQIMDPLSVFYATALISKINETQIEEETGQGKQVTQKQEVTLKLLSSKLKDKEFTVINEITNNPYDLKLKQNEKILVNIEEYPNNNYKIFIAGYYRLSGIIALFLLFLILLIILGGKQGLKTVISLIISIILIFKILIPQTLKGHNPVIIALIIAILITIITLFLITGYNKKSLIAILGTLGGLVVAVIISYIFTKLTYLNGLSTEEARTLFYESPQINSQGIFFAGIIIAALGAVMDVAMSIASSLTEIKKVNPNLHFRNIFKSGINVGKDIMGTMSNTLIFAYVGVSFPLLLLYGKFGDSYINFLNLDFITDEIVRSLSGSIGLIAVIPLTSLIAAFLYSKKK